MSLRRLARPAWQACRPLVRRFPVFSAPARHFSEVTSAAEAEDGSLIAPEDAAPSWLLLRPKEVVKVAPKVDVSDGDFGELRLSTAPASLVVEEALSLAYTASWTEDASQRWQEVVEELLRRELNSSQALLVFHCLTRLDFHHPVLLERMADRLESRYFSATHDIEDVEDDVEALRAAMAGKSPRKAEAAAELLAAFPRGDEESFQSLIENLPLSHKVALILIRCTSRPRRGGRAPQRTEVPPEPDVKKAWKTTDPIDMEEFEKERYLSGRWKVLRMRDVKAKVKRMPPGKRLRATLASQLLQVLPSADANALAEISQITAFPNSRLLTGDLDLDFREALAKRIGALDRTAIWPRLVAFATALSGGDGPEAYRAWRRRLIPDALALMQLDKRDAILANQRFVHARLGGVVRDPGRERAETAARLLIAFAGAKQVAMDVQLLDALCAPLEDALEQRLEGPEDDEGAQGLPLAPETIADILSAVVSCGVQPKRLHQLLVDCLLREKVEFWEGCDPADLCTIASAVSLLCGDSAQAVVEVMWTAVLPRLRKVPPALALAMIDAVVRGGSDELLHSESVRTAVDELLVQRVDFELSALGHIGH